MAKRKYKQVASVLREQILSGVYPAGQALPPLKELAPQFDISFATASRAVGVLSNDGLVSTAQKRRGTVVLRNTIPAPPQSRTIGCLLRPPRPRNESDNFGLDILEGIREEVSARGYRFIYHGVDEADYENRVAQLVKGEHVCGLILDQQTPRPTVEALAKLGAPVVVYNRCVPVPAATFVLPDYEAVARETVRFFLSRGYERVGLYKVPMDEPHWNERIIGNYYPNITLRRAFGEAARACGLDDSRIVLIPESPEQVNPRPEAYGLPARRGADWRSLGILATNDTLATGLLSAIEKTSLRLGEDVGIVGVFDLVGAQNSPRPPTTWRIDGRAIGRASVRELLARVESPGTPASVIRLNPEFVDRGTA